MALKYVAHQEVRVLVRLSRRCEGTVEICWRFSKNIRWAAPIVFGPRTLLRTWGTRPIPFGPCYDTDSCETGPSSHPGETGFAMYDSDSPPVLRTISLTYSLCPRFARLLRLPDKTTVLGDESPASMQQPPHDKSFVGPPQRPYFAFQSCWPMLLFSLSLSLRLLEARPRWSSRPTSPA
jgi:hypothetical protein